MIANESIDVNFGLSLHLLPFFVFANSEGSVETAHICEGLPEPSLLDDVITTKILCTCSFILISAPRKI